MREPPKMDEYDFMVPPPAHRIVGYRIDYPGPTARTIAYTMEHFVAVDRYDAATSYNQRLDSVYHALDMVAYRHLGVPGAPDAGPWVQGGFDCALHLFLDDWRTPPDPHAPKAKPYNLVIAARRRDKEVGWFEHFSRGLILGLLSGRREDVRRFCSWPWAELVPDYSGMGDDLEDEVALMYLVLASGLRDEPMPGIEPVMAKIRRCRLKRPRLLLKLWEAAQAGEQVAFAEALIRSLEHFAAVPRLDPADARIGDRLALPQTAISLAAGCRGLRVPALPPELSAFLITRRSLGLDD